MRGSGGLLSGINRVGPSCSPRTHTPVLVSRADANIIQLSPCTARTCAVHSKRPPSARPAGPAAGIAAVFVEAHAPVVALCITAKKPPPIPVENGWTTLRTNCMAAAASAAVPPACAGRSEGHCQAPAAGGKRKGANLDGSHASLGRQVVCCRCGAVLHHTRPAEGQHQGRLPSKSKQACWGRRERGRDSVCGL